MPDSSFDGLRFGGPFHSRGCYPDDVRMTALLLGLALFVAGIVGLVGGLDLGGVWPWPSLGAILLGVVLLRLSMNETRL